LPRFFFACPADFAGMAVLSRSSLFHPGDGYPRRRDWQPSYRWLCGSQGLRSPGASLQHAVSWPARCWLNDACKDNGTCPIASKAASRAAGDLTALSDEERYKFFYDRKHLIGK
jgi:hypothetical protein